MALVRFSALAVDLDGTLLDNRGKLGRKNLSSLQALNKFGVKIFLCSARAPLSVAYFSKAIGLQTPIIAHNGASLTGHDGVAVIKSHFIEELETKSLFRRVESLELLTSLYINNDWYIDQPERVYADNSSLIGIKPIVVQDLASTVASAVSKIVFNCTGDEEEKLKVILRDPEFEDLRWTVPKRGYFEVLPSKANKSSMLNTAIDMFGISSNELVAIGNYFNDIELFEYAALSIAVANAPEEVKRHADMVVSSNENSGVAEAIDLLMKDTI